MENCWHFCLCGPLVLPGPLEHRSWQSFCRRVTPGDWSVAGTLQTAEQGRGYEESRVKRALEKRSHLERRWGWTVVTEEKRKLSWNRRVRKARESATLLSPPGGGRVPTSGQPPESADPSLAQGTSHNRWQATATLSPSQGWFLPAFSWSLGN